MHTSADEIARGISTGINEEQEPKEEVEFIDRSFIDGSSGVAHETSTQPALSSMGVSLARFVATIRSVHERIAGALEHGLAFQTV
jgi:hypothetical protein